MFSQSQNVAQGHFMVGSHEWIQTHAGPDEKCSFPSAFPDWNTSDPKTLSQYLLCRDSPLGPSEYQETLNTTHPRCVREDGMLRSSQPMAD